MIIHSHKQNIIWKTSCIFLSSFDGWELESREVAVSSDSLPAPAPIESFNDMVTIAIFALSVPCNLFSYMEDQD